MGTVTVRMPDEEIEKLERMAEREGKSRSALIREFVEKEMEKNTVSSLWDLVGILSDDEADELREIIEKNRKRTTEDVKKRAREAFDK